MSKWILLLLALFAFPLPGNANEARHYVPLLSGEIQCRLCPRECVIPEARQGTCRARKNVKDRGQ